MIRSRSVAAIVAVLLLAGACGERASEAEGPPPGASAGSAVGAPVVDADGMRTLQRLEESLNFLYAESFPTISALAARMPVVLTGTVDAVLPGRSILVAANANNPVATRESTLLIRVRVVEAVKAEAPGSVTDGFVYLARTRAVNDVDAQGEVIGADTYPSIADLRKAIPVGTRVAIASQPSARALEPAERIESDPHPIPAGAVTLVGHGQGVIYDRGTDVELGQSTWTGLTFDDVVAELGTTP